MAYAHLRGRRVARSGEADKSSANGIYHLCGSECLTIADIAYRVADVLGLNRSLIRPVTTKEMNEKTPRPRFSGLSIEKAHRELGYQPRTLEEGIKQMFGW